MADERCVPGEHLGEDLEGRCSACGERLERPNLLLTVLYFVAIVAAVTLVTWLLLLWWVRG